MLLAKLTPRWSHPAGETHLSVAPCCWRATVRSGLVRNQLQKFMLYYDI
jgi:hypothetical protein